MLTNLIQYWREYEAAMKAANYNADTVQALGMRFCDEWKRSKKNIICKLLEEYRIHIKLDDLEYADHRWVMKKLDVERKPVPEPCKLCH